MKRGFRTYLGVAAAVIALSAFTACGGKSGISSPTSPSLPSAPASGATIRGQVNRGNLTVSVTGSSVSAGVDNSGHFELDNAPAGNLELQFTGQGVTARVGIGQVADHDRLDLQITLFGNSGSVDAMEHVGSDDSAEVEGSIASINSANRSLQIGNANVQVASDARIVSSTASLSFGDLKVGMRVQIEGSLQGSAVVAEQVKVEDDAQNEPPEQEIQFTGTISGLSGACPALSMTVAGKSVASSSSTAFVNGLCGDLKNGSTVEVEGNVGAGGKVTASQIQLEDAIGGGNGGGGGTGGGDNGGGSGGSGGSGGGNLVTVQGFVPGFIPPSGSCPAITFGVESKATGAYIDTFIHADASTQYSGGACSGVQLGVFLEVQGELQADRSLRAVVVKFTPKGAPVIASK